MILQFYQHRWVFLCWLIWLAMQAFPQPFMLGEVAPVTLAVALILLFMVMLGCIFTVVRHADVLAERLGEPYGTLVLTLSATAIEVSLLLMVMMGGEQNPTLLRDTVFATLMVVLNGMVGTSLVAGGWRHLEQGFNLKGALAFLQLITPLSLLMLVLPNYTVSLPGPRLSIDQEIFMGAMCVVVYAIFLLLQTGRHRSHFTLKAASLADGGGATAVAGTDNSKDPKASSTLLLSCGGLLFSLLPIVLLSEHLGAIIDYGIDELKLSPSLGGLIVTALVLAPEGVGAYRAAVANRMQRAVNICLGSALSTIALTIPAVLIATASMGHSLVIGLTQVESTLLYATLMVSLITFISGRSNLLQGTVHLMLFVSYLFFIIKP
jgi:Ca2+:H+ antiporter